MDKSKNFKKIVQLCPETSPSTSSVVCFSGLVKHGDGNFDRMTFVEIASCLEKIRLFKYENDTWDEFRTKLQSLSAALNEFALVCEDIEKEELKEIQENEK